MLLPSIGWTENLGNGSRRDVTCYYRDATGLWDRMDELQNPQGTTDPQHLERAYDSIRGVLEAWERSCRQGLCQQVDFFLWESGSPGAHPDQHRARRLEGLDVYEVERFNEGNKWQTTLVAKVEGLEGLTKTAHVALRVVQPRAQLPGLPLEF
jgi:hypothetical protein